MREIKILEEALSSLPARVKPKAIGVSVDFWLNLKLESFKEIPIKVIPDQHFEYRFLWD